MIGILFRGHIFSFKNLACFQPPGMSIYCTALRIPDFDPSRRPGASQGGISRLRSTSYRFPLLMQRLRPAFSADLRPVGGRKSFFFAHSDRFYRNVAHSTLSMVFFGSTSRAYSPTYTYRAVSAPLSVTRNLPALDGYKLSELMRYMGDERPVLGLFCPVCFSEPPAVSSRKHFGSGSGP